MKSARIKLWAPPHAVNRIALAAGPATRLNPLKLLRLAKGRGLVNRLGFVVDVAVTLAKENGERGKVSRLRALSNKLWTERYKEAEEFLMSEAPEDPELRNWLKKKTPRAGKKWGVYGAYSRERFREALKKSLRRRFRSEKGPASP